MSSPSDVELEQLIYFIGANRLRVRVDQVWNTSSSPLPGRFALRHSGTLFQGESWSITGPKEFSVQFESPGLINPGPDETFFSPGPGRLFSTSLNDLPPYSGVSYVPSA